MEIQTNTSKFSESLDSSSFCKNCFFKKFFLQQIFGEKKIWIGGIGHGGTHSLLLFIFDAHQWKEKRYNKMEVLNTFRWEWK